MSENWQAGDMALCVGKGLWDPNIPLKPQPGQCFSVVKVLSHPREGWCALVFAEQPGAAYASEYFRKVTRPKADTFDREVIELMRGAPAKVDA